MMKRLIFLIALFFCITWSYSQNGWFKAIGEQGFEKATNIKMTEDGGFVVVGETESYGLAERDMLVHRFDANANLLWTKTYGGEEREVINDMAQLKNGSFIIVAEKYQPNKQEGEALTLLKTATNGSLIWKKVLDEAGQETEGFSLKLLKDGLAIAGMMKSVSTVSDAFFNMRAEEQHMYLLKTDFNGNKIWSRKLQFSATSASSTASDMHVSNDEHFIIVGNMTLKGKTDKKIERPAKDINYLESRSGLLVKVNIKGNLLWAKSYTIGNITMNFAIKPLKNGGFLIAGNTLLGLNDMDIFLMETNPAGEVKWVKTYGTKAFESFADIVQTDDGGWLATAISSIHSSNFEDVLIFKTDSIGKVIWSKTTGSKNEDYPARILKTKNEYIIAGSSGGFGSKSFDVILFSITDSGKTCAPVTDVAITERHAKAKMQEFMDAKMVTVDQGILPPNVKRISSNNIKENSRQPLERNLCK